MMSAAGRSLLARSDVILFDFDGPLCDVFGNRPAPEVARELEAVAGRQFGTDDPLKILELTFQADRGAAEAVEDALIEAEVGAVSIAQPELDGVAVLKTLHRIGKRIGIVSNNSTPAVYVFLDRLNVRSLVSVVVGRAYRHPELMKPNPWALYRALTLLNVTSSDAAFIGDSMTDIEASERAEVSCIAFANMPSKLTSFRASGVPVITAMRDLQDA